MITRSSFLTICSLCQNVCITVNLPLLLRRDSKLTSETSPLLWKPDKAGFSAVAHMWNGQNAHLRKEVIKKQKVCNLDTKSAAEPLAWVVTIVIFKTVHFFIYYRLSSICQTHNKRDTAMRMDLVQLSEFWASYTIEISFSF